MHARAALLSTWLLCLPLLATAQTEPGTLPATIPLFPLQDVMLFPHVVRPLHIFEPRYREMLLYALAGERIIGMVTLRPGHENEYFGNPPIYPVGCAGVIANVEGLPDGRYNIVLEGLVKFRVESEDQTYAYRVAEVEAIPETLTDEEQKTLRGHRGRLLELLATVAPGDPAPTVEDIPDEELVNGLAQFLPMDPDQRQSLLEQDDALARAEALLKIVDRDVVAP
jgi:Lon protease-like protein